MKNEKFIIMGSSGSGKDFLSGLSQKCGMWVRVPFSLQKNTL